MAVVAVSPPIDQDAEAIRSHLLLLVEDNEGDAELVKGLLDQIHPETYQVVDARDMAEAKAMLRERDIDIVLLDLNLPDTGGVDSVKALRELSDRVPIVVLTGADEYEVALSCIDAGAQDYLLKNELGSFPLRRAIGYAISRLRERQLRELQQALDEYRSLTTAASGTSITAAIVGAGAVSDRYPEALAQLRRDYSSLLNAAHEGRLFGKLPSRDLLQSLVTRLGDLSGGPRDLLDIHVSALDDLVGGNVNDRAHALVVEGRLLALEVMGMLVDYYRVGVRRSFSEELS